MTPSANGWPAATAGPERTRGSGSANADTKGGTSGALPARALVEVREVSHVFSASGSARPVEALRNVTLEVREGEFLAVVGPSGCGKSTLLEIMAGLLAPTRGEVCIRGEPVRGPHPEIGVVFQEDSAFPWLTALENIEFGLKMRGVPAPRRREAALAMMELVGLKGFEHHLPHQLSGGMRQRVAIARTLVLQPRIILMDEPFGALDAQTRLSMGDELLRICDRIRATVFFVTHDIAEAVRLADRIVLMSARPGTVRQVLDNPLPRPREFSAVASRPEFSQLVGFLWEQLRREVAR